MLTWFTSRAERNVNAHNLYGSIVTLSRSPAIYDVLKVPDTVEGRFEIMILHIFACLERMNGEEPALAQNIVNIFFADMDTTSRELGVGDMVVPKKMRALASIFEARMSEYHAAVAASNKNTLSDMLLSDIYGGEEGAPKNAKELGRYMRKLRQNLAKKPISDLVAGKIPAPEIVGKNK